MQEALSDTTRSIAVPEDPPMKCPVKGDNPDTPPRPRSGASERVGPESCAPAKDEGQAPGPAPKALPA